MGNSIKDGVAKALDLKTLEITPEFDTMLQEMSDRQRLAGVSALFWITIWARLAPFGEAPTMDLIMSKQALAIAYSPDTFVFDQEAEDTVGEREPNSDDDSIYKDSAGAASPNARPNATVRDANATGINGNAYRQVVQNADQVVRALGRLKLLKEHGYEPTMTTKEAYEQTLESYKKSRERRQAEEENRRLTAANKVLSGMEQSASTESML